MSDEQGRANLTKICTKCGEEKLLDAFTNQHTRKDGKYSSCRGCRSIASREYRSKVNSRRTNQDQLDIIAISTKVCTNCREEKSLDAFYKNQKGNVKSWCKSCTCVYQAKLYQERRKITNLTGKDKDHVRYLKRKKWLRDEYGISLEQYQAMYKSQGGVCAICGMTETARNQWGLLSLAVDHDHKTGKVRSLLCRRCNRLLVDIERDTSLFESAIDYIRFHCSQPCNASNEETLEG